MGNTQTKELENRQTADQRVTIELIRKIKAEQKIETERIVIAKQRIKESKDEGSDSLTLNNLDLTSEDLVEIIPIIAQELPELKVLYLFENNIENLPDSIENLTNLDFLYLNGNKIKSLPNSIGNLKNLSVLNISDNNLKHLPDSIGKLTKLNTLYIGGNPPISLPDSLRNLSRLEIFEINCYSHSYKNHNIHKRVKEIIQNNLHGTFISSTVDNFDFSSMTQTLNPSILKRKKNQPLPHHQKWEKEPSQCEIF